MKTTITWQAASPMCKIGLTRRTPVACLAAGNYAKSINFSTHRDEYIFNKNMSSLRLLTSIPLARQVFSKSVGTASRLHGLASVGVHHLAGEGTPATGNSSSPIWMTQLRRGNAQTATERTAAPAGDPLSATIVLDTTLNAEHRQMIVKWNDGTETQYPYTWLRDGCQCSACFNRLKGTRRLLFHELDLNVMPTEVETNSRNQEISVTWSDEHRSVYRYQWLLDRSFRHTEQTVRENWTQRTPQLWNSSIVEKIPHIDFNNLLTNGKDLYKWITHLEETGLVVLTGAPQKQAQLQEIAAQVAYLKKTHYGKTAIAHSEEYTNSETGVTSCLELHNDLVGYSYVPGVKMVHCVSQSTVDNGHLCQFVDGFYAAQLMKKKFPHYYHRLSTVKLDFNNIGDGFNVLARHRTIRLDEDGDIVQINYSNRARDSFLRMPLEGVDELYHALKAFTDLLYDKNNLIEIEQKPGNIYCFDNHRILHGRTSSHLSNHAVFESGYIDWDEMHSKRRVLKKALQLPDEE